MTSISDVNAYFLRRSLWPAVSYTMFLMLSGLLGNALVLIVYRRHFRHSVTRMFIYSLALLDIANCLITMPSELIVLIQFASFPSPVWCKLSRYLTYILNGSSSVLLIGIAVDRYYKVCHPTTVFITIKRARIICLGALLFNALLALPALVLYGDMTLTLQIIDNEVSVLGVEQKDYNKSATTLPDHVKEGVTLPYPIPHKAEYIVGHFCLIKNSYINTVYPIVFYASMFSLYLALVVVVIFSYTRLARTMYLLRQRHDRMFSFIRYYKGSNSAIPEPSGHGEGAADRPAVGEHQDQDHYEDRCSVKIGGGQFLTLEESNLNVDGEAGCVREEQEEGHLAKVSQDGIAAKDESAQGKNEALNPGSGVEKAEMSTNIEHPNSEMEDSAMKISQGQSEKPKEEVHTKNYQEPAVNSIPQDRQATGLTAVCKPETTVANGTKGGQGYSGQVPRVRVHKPSRTESKKEFTFPSLACENSLLMRRIHSMENVRGVMAQPALSLSQLDIEHRQNGKFSTSDKNKPGPMRRRDWQSLDALRPHALNVTTSYSVDIVDGDPERQDHWSPGNTDVKTLTLTRRSPKGSKHLCVLPLTGLSSKTALHALEQNDQKDGHVVIDSCQRGVVVDADEITLRTKSTSPQGMQKKSPQSDLKTPASPRREVISTADLLKEQHRGNALHPFRTSRMLFIISLVFVVSFCPFFIIALIRSAQGASFTDLLGETELAVVSVLIRSSLISNAVNPIVYGFLSTHFRKECVALFCNLFRKQGS
ncbi:uncharacterized protein LOC101855207 [Aplysia californica]|uniref:Uncharacterized protein LOC101855207 n=1 Tax=Aplysia californica TaxID=6500 RepID=A0ABM0K071_APLCA|nr:uncharacterized protein LOC101855207 [Aplysia californica]